ncbi:MAG: DUF898 domain-containing protein [Xanthomonadales bacterium]|nr:DUF898 domain-containing protein [Xanthomonadales bacterium]
MHEDAIGANAAAPPPPPRAELPDYWPPPAPPQPDPVEYAFSFDGSAREYFRIWIVNLALSIVTLGIYSAWAKVRTQRYFYANTRLAGVPFEYLAKPLPILKGRIIAVTLFTAYVLAGQFSLVWQLGLLAVIALATPWLIVRGLAFRARYSSWRGLVFRFIPDYGEAYIRYLLLLLPMVLTLGILYPWVQGKQKQFVVEHHRFGGHAFRFLTTPGRFYIPYLIAWGVITGWVFVAMFGVVGMTMATVGEGTGRTPPTWIPFAMMAVLYAGYFVVFVFLSAALVNLVYNHVDIGGRRLQSRLKGRRLLAIYALNTLAVLASAGLLIPWAKIRLARYRAESTGLLARDDLEGLVAERRGEIDATAAEVDGLFDIDIGL